MSSVWIGFDPRPAEVAAFGVCRHSLFKNIPSNWSVYGLILSDLQARGLYTRPTKRKLNGDGRFEMIDELSIRADYDGRVSTEHAISRFLVPHLARSIVPYHSNIGWAVFMDGDMLVRGNVGQLVQSLDRTFALYCVKHNYQPKDTVKMDGQQQSVYMRKNWSSFMIFNVDHPANKSLTVEMVNTLPGRDLHRMAWLDDSEIGELGPEWNFLVGETDKSVSPKVLHYTLGLPNMPGYEDCDFADDWRLMLDKWARGPLSLPG